MCHMDYINRLVQTESNTFPKRYNITLIIVQACQKRHPKMETGMKTLFKKPF